MGCFVLSVVIDRWHSSRQKCGECLIYISVERRLIWCIETEMRRRPGLRGHPCRYYAEGVRVQT